MFEHSGRRALVRAVRHTLCSGRRGETVASRQAAERAAGQSPGAGGVEVAGARLLVIDDEQRILDFVARGLRAEGYTVEVPGMARRDSPRRWLIRMISSYSTC